MKFTKRRTIRGSRWRSSSGGEDSLEQSLTGDGSVGEASRIKFISYYSLLHWGKYCADRRVGIEHRIGWWWLHCYPSNLLAPPLSFLNWVNLEHACHDLLCSNPYTSAYFLHYWRNLSAKCIFKSWCHSGSEQHIELSGFQMLSLD